MIVPGPPPRRSRPTRRAAALLLAAVLGGWSAHAHGALDAPPDGLWFHHLTNEDGLPQNFVTAMAQDNTGYLWFATVGGLARFDGREVVVFQPDPDDPASLPEMTVLALTVARDGTLWIGTQNLGLVRYRPDGTFASYPFAGAPGGPGLPDQVESIAEAADGTLWVAGAGRLARFDPGTGEAERIDTGPHVVGRALLARGDAVWAGAPSTLLRIEAGTGRWEAVALPPARADPGAFLPSRLLMSRDGQLHVGTTEGLLGYDPVTGRFSDHRDAVGGLVQDVAAYGEAALLLLSRRGLEHFDTRTGAATVVLDSFYDLPTLPSLLPFVSVFISSDGVLWLGSNGTGVLYADLRTSRFPLYGSIPGDPSTLANPFVRSVAADSATAWIGTARGGIARMDLRTRAVERLGPAPFGPGNPDRFDSEETAWGLDLDRSGRLWASYPDRTELRDPQTGRLVQRYPVPEAYAPVFAPMFHYEDARGRHWTGRPTFGTVDPETGSFSPVLGTPEEPLVVHRLHDAGNTFWLATLDRGLVRYDLATGDTVAYRPVLGDGTSVSSDNVQSLWAGEDGTLWLGTLAGLNRFDPASGTAVRYTSQNSELPNNFVNGLLGDDRGHLWISTNRGLTRFDPATDAFITYAVDRGLQSSEFNRGAYARSPGGTLLFGGIEGLNVFDPAALVDNQTPPRLALSDFSVNGVPMRTAGPALAEALGPDQNTLRFQYTALHFSNPALNRFQYRLAGYDADWSAVTDRNAVRYTNLPPGAYTFHLRAANPFGVWSKAEALLSFSVRPPVWASWWFRLLALGLFVAAAGVVALYRHRRVRQREDELRHLVGERTAALRAEKDLTEQQASALLAQSLQQRRLFADLSHETRTPLTLILSPVEQLLETDLDTPTRRALTLVRRNAHRLLFFFNQILDLARLEGGAMTLQPRRFDLGEFVEGVVQAFQNLALGRQQRLTAAVPDLPVFVTADPAMLEVVLFNLVGNALKFTPAGGRVHVALSASEHRVRLTVEDTGVGIAPEHLGYVFDRFERAASDEPGTGIGLALVREIARAHGGDVQVESTLGEGTTFTMAWPRLALGEDAPPLAEFALGDNPEVLFRSLDSSEDTASPGDSTTILVVDDNDDVRGYIRDLLAPSFHVVQAAAGEEGLAKARDVVPDLVVSDVRMPGLDGYELCAAIKADPALQFVPVILLTADGAAPSRVRGLELGADDFVVKPFHAPELRARIDNLLASRRAWRERLGVPAPLDLPFEDAFEDLPAADDALRARLGEIIHERFVDGDFSAGPLAEAAGLSSAHLRRKTQELFGHSPTELIRRYRLRQAASLLKRGTGTVAEIAYSVGFNSVSYFTRAFRDLYEVVPSAYADTAPGPSAGEEEAA
ncbi:MAG: ATP-binding protein [Bacteroidota bacterium]